MARDPSEGSPFSDVKDRSASDGPGFLAFLDRLFGSSQPTPQQHAPISPPANTRPTQPQALKQPDPPSRANLHIAGVDFEGGWVFGKREGFANTPYFGLARGRQHDGVDLYQPNAGSGAHMLLRGGPEIVVRKAIHSVYGRTAITMSDRVELDQPVHVHVTPYKDDRSGFRKLKKYERVPVLGGVKAISVFKLYAHMSEYGPNVAKGQMLNDGDSIGRNGSSRGVRTKSGGLHLSERFSSSMIKPHLHLEYHLRLEMEDGRVEVVPVDPQILLGRDLQGPALDLTDPANLRDILKTAHKTNMASYIRDVDVHTLDETLDAYRSSGNKIAQAAEPAVRERATPALRTNFAVQAKSDYEPGAGGLVDTFKANATKIDLSFLGDNIDPNATVTTQVEAGGWTMVRVS